MYLKSLFMFVFFPVSFFFFHIFPFACFKSKLCLQQRIGIGEMESSKVSHLQVPLVSWNRLGKMYQNMYEKKKEKKIQDIFDQIYKVMSHIFIIFFNRVKSETRKFPTNERGEGMRGIWCFGQGIAGGLGRRKSQTRRRRTKNLEGGT